jgi:hypothetical protein
MNNIDTNKLAYVHFDLLWQKRALEDQIKQNTEETVAVLISAHRLDLISVNWRRLINDRSSID